MSKSKPSKKPLDYFECTVCGCLASVVVQSKHAQVCNSNDTSLLFNHSFIKNSSLYGLITLINEKDIPHLPSRLKSYTVYLNLAAIKLCHLRIGNSVIVHAINSVEILTVWPLQSIQSFNVGLLSQTCKRLKCKSGDIISIHHMKGPLLAARKISLITRDTYEFLSGEPFKNYFKHIHDNLFFTAGNIISFKYLGQPCRFIVITVEGIEGNVISTDEDVLKTSKEEILNESETSSLNHLTFDLSSLDISKEENGEKELHSFSLNSPTKFFSENDSDHLSSTPVRTKNCYSLPKEFEATNFYYIYSDTIIDIVNLEHLHLEKKKSDVTFDSLGGLSQPLDELRKIIEMFKHIQQGLLRTVPSGILLQGPSGTGKTSIAKAIANELGSSFLTITASQIYSKYFGETESRLKEIFQEAQNRAPSVIFIDEIDTLCPRRDSSQTEQEKRVVTTFTTLMDGLSQLPVGKQVLVLAATNTPNVLDPAIRRPGRLTKEIEIGIPNALDRKEILSKHLNKGRHNITMDQISSIADQLHGFVGADIAELCNEARNISIDHCILDHPNKTDSELSKLICVTLVDLKNALHKVKPSSLREVAIEIPKVHWSDIGGLTHIKKQLWEIIDLPLKFPDFFQRLGLSSRGILLFGPPGCSKTMIAQALATEYGLNFLTVKGPELFSKYVGESERAVRELFKKAGDAAPSIIFFDEIESLTAERGSSSNVGDRVVSQLLTELDGILMRKEIFVVAATNRPDMIDPALLRFGRFGNLIYVPLPDEETRKEIFHLWLKKLQVTYNEIDINELVQQTQGYSGAEIVSICQTAGIKAISENVTSSSVKVEMKHFHQALQQVRAQTTPEQIRFYEKYALKMASNFS